MTAKPKKRRKRRRWWILLVVLLVSLFGLSRTSLVGRLTGRNTRSLGVRTEVVKRMDNLKSIVSANGEIQAKESVDLQTEIAGLIVELPVEEGDRVEEGQILVRIDPEQTRSDVRGAEAQLEASIAESNSSRARVASARAELAQAKFQLKSSEVDLVQGEVSLLRSEANLRRQKELFDDRLISAEEYEVAETQARLDQARVEAAEAGIEQAKARIEAFEVGIEQSLSSSRAAESRVEASRAGLERLQDLLAKTTIRSPLTGLIVRRNVDLGERAVPGVLSNPQATLLTIADLSAIEAHIEVDETDIVTVALGDVAEIVVDALPEQPFSGEVTEIGNSPINQGSSNDAKDFKVVVRLDSPDDVLRPGLSCNADITTDERNDVLVLPISALVIRESFVDEDGNFLSPVEKNDEADQPGGVQAASREEEGGNPGPGSSSSESETADRESESRKKEEIEGVFVLDEDNRARFRPVKTGITGEMEVELLEGLNEGDVLITGPYKILRTIQDGDSVRQLDSDKSRDEEDQ